MSRKCENCGVHIRGFFTHTTPAVRQDETSGFIFRFCSEECANQWVDRRRQPLPLSWQAASPQSEESRQIEQHWLADGGA